MSRGAPGRVAAVHRQTRPSLLVCLAFVLAAVLVAVLDGPQGRWTALHLFLIGGLLSAISSVTVYLAVTWSASPAPRSALAAAQRWTLAAGALGVAGSIRVGAPAWTTAVSAAVVSAALVGSMAILLGVRRSATVDRFLPAIDAYLLALALGVGGSLLGGLLAAGTFDEHFERFHAAHLRLNIFGLVGLVVAGTLPYMVATQARTKMSPRAAPGAVWSIVVTLTATNGVILLGSARADDRLVAAGLAAYAIALLALVRILPSIRRRQLDWAGPRIIQLFTGVLWWAVCTAALAWVAYVDGDPSRVLLALVVGGYAQILTASLAYLGPVVRGGGHVQLGKGFATTRSWLSLAVGNVAAAAALTGADTLMLGALAVWGLDTAARAGALLLGRTPGSGPPGTAPAETRDEALPSDGTVRQ